MKKIFFAIFISCMFFNSSFASCTQAHCYAEIESRNSAVRTNLEELYNQLNGELDALSQAYTEYEDALKEQNLLLENLQTLAKQNSLLEKEISFLLGVDKEVISLTIDSVATEKEIDK